MTNLVTDSNWYNPTDKLPIDGAYCLIIVEGCVLPLLCTFEKGVFYQVYARLLKKGFSYQMHRVDSSILAWRSNIGLKVKAEK